MTPEFVLVVCGSGIQKHTCRDNDPGLGASNTTNHISKLDAVKPGSELVRL